jgi:hypothetical protein
MIQAVAGIVETGSRFVGRGKASDVDRTQIYVTAIANWREAGEVHSEFFESIRPATTMVQVGCCGPRPVAERPVVC